MEKHKKEVIVEVMSTVVTAQPSGDLTLNFSKIPGKYKIADFADDLVVAYRGDSLNLAESGILSKAFCAGDHEKINIVKRIVENGSEQEIQKVIDSHTASSKGSRLFPLGSPFISVSLDPEVAQAFATKKGTTIYRLNIPANRALADFDDFGKFGCAQELLVLGKIFPSEIAAVKIKNGDHHSELRLLVDGREFVKWLPNQTSKTRTVKDTRNWLQIRR